MADKIKEFFGEEQLLLTMDPLYANQHVMEICEKNSWDCIIRFQEGSISTISREYADAKESGEATRFISGTLEGEVEYAFLNGAFHRGRIADFAELKLDSGTYPFIFTANLPLGFASVYSIVAWGRRRWKIEASFDIQKHHGFNIEHLYTNDWNGTKADFLLIQIGHAMSQLASGQWAGCTPACGHLRHSWATLWKASSTTP
jgi:hypothetical protein